jgi:hypothetical protein
MSLCTCTCLRDFLFLVLLKCAACYIFALNFKGHKIKAHWAPKPFEMLMDVKAGIINI